MYFTLGESIGSLKEGQLNDLGELLEDVRRSTTTEETPGAESARFTTAYESFELAERNAGHKLTSKQAYEWLRENGPAHYRMPTFQTWNRYVRQARTSRGQQKNTPRGGRTGRSIASAHDLQARRKED